MSVAKIHKKSLTATVSPDIIVSIDQLRGEIPRSRAVEHALESYIETETKKRAVLLKANQAREQAATTAPTTTENSGVEPKLNDM